jgi:hypothetical protein
MPVPFPYDIRESATLKEKPPEWIVCYQGFQLGGDYDSSGAGNLTFSTYEEALSYIHDTTS